MENGFGIIFLLLIIGVLGLIASRQQVPNLKYHYKMVHMTDTGTIVWLKRDNVPLFAKYDIRCVGYGDFLETLNIVQFYTKEDAVEYLLSNIEDSKEENIDHEIRNSTSEKIKNLLKISKPNRRY